MPRLPTPGKHETSHVTVRCNNREFLLRLTENFDDLVSWINSLNIMYDVDIHHVLFMSNHVHILLTPNHNNLGFSMSYFLTNASKFLNYKLKRKDHIFGKRYRATVVKNSRHFMNVIRYIYQNPVRAKMVESVDQYPYSSLGFYLGQKNNGLILKPDHYTQYLFNLGFDGWQTWTDAIREPLLDNDVSLLRKSFERKVFGFSIRQLRSADSNGTKLMI